MDPANVLVLAEAGSHMYGLSTPTSDTDYIIVYRQPTKVLLVIKLSYGRKVISQYLTLVVCFVRASRQHREERDTAVKWFMHTAANFNFSFS